MVIENISEVRKAKEQILQGSLTIWNARLDALVQTGDAGAAIDHLITSCDGDQCNCGCGGMIDPGMFVSQPAKATRARK